MSESKPEEYQVLRLISPKLIEFDLKNPRGETPEQIEKDTRFNVLRRSVKQHGVLVPLITRENKNKKKPFRLVDGERRLRASLKEKTPLVPIHIIHGDEIDGRILAYNIHMLRKQWSKECELTSMKEIRDELLVEDKDLTETELSNKLRDITNLSPSHLSDLIRLLKYDKKAIEAVHAGTIQMSHLVQIDASFISQIEKKFPGIYAKYGDTKLRSILVKKAEKGLVGNTRYIMDVVRPYFKSADNLTNLRSAIKKFIDEEDQHVSIIDVKMKATKKAKKAKKKKKKKAKKKKTGTKSHDSEFEYGSINITKGHLTRINDIRPKLEKIAKRFTDEETEYIKEGVCCLENHCFKGAALMVWSTGISRIFKYIEKHLSDFNRCTKEMRDNPKSFYKYFAPHFIKNVMDITTVRENCNDRQLLCYICYKKFITVPEFKKLKNNYDTRCDCAHPTSILLKPNEIIVIFENVYSLLLNNPKLK